MRQGMQRPRFRTAFARAGFAIPGTVAMALLIGQSSVLAQQPAQPKATPKAQSKQPTPPGQAQPQQGQASAPSAQDMRVVYSPWTKHCQKEQTPTGEKTTCSTQMLARLETNQFLAGAMLIEVQDEATKFIRLMLPLGILLPAGARFAVDKDELVTAPYLVCISDACLAQKDVSAEFATKLKKGQILTLQGNTPAGQIATYQLPLTDFAKANDGSPTTAEDLEQQRKKFEEELQRKGQDLKKRMPPQGDGDR